MRIAPGLALSLMLADGTLLNPGGPQWCRLLTPAGQGAPAWRNLAGHGSAAPSCVTDRDASSRELRALGPAGHLALVVVRSVSRSEVVPFSEGLPPPANHEIALSEILPRPYRHAGFLTGLAAATASSTSILRYRTIRMQPKYAMALGIRHSPTTRRDRGRLARSRSGRRSLGAGTTSMDSPVKESGSCPGIRWHPSAGLAATQGISPRSPHAGRAALHKCGVMAKSAHTLYVANADLGIGSWTRLTLDALRPRLHDHAAAARPRPHADRHHRPGRPAGRRRWTPGGPHCGRLAGQCRHLDRRADRAAARRRGGRGAAPCSYRPGRGWIRPPSPTYRGRPPSVAKDLNEDQMRPSGTAPRPAPG